MSLTEIFSKNPQIIKPFELFGTDHLLTLAVLAAAVAVMTVLARKYEKIGHGYKWFLLISIPLQEITYKIWDGVYGGLDLEIIFSLHLCSMAIILIVVLLVKYNQNIFEIVYFWGLGGAMQPLLTPDISYTGFPHFRFFQVFFSHGMIIAAVFYFLLVEKRTLRPGSLKRVILITNIYAVIVFIINYIFGTNYLFVNHTPGTASLIDSLGAWPFYLIWLEVLLVVIFSLLYLPVYLRRKTRLRKLSDSGQGKTTGL
jgi:hypothetical integral membrane protein (TIGR02206 family)